MRRIIHPEYRDITIYRAPDNLCSVTGVSSDGHRVSIVKHYGSLDFKQIPPRDISIFRNVDEAYYCLFELANTRDQYLYSYKSEDEEIVEKFYKIVNDLEVGDLMHRASRPVMRLSKRAIDEALGY